MKVLYYEVEYFFNGEAHLFGKEHFHSYFVLIKKEGCAKIVQLKDLKPHEI